jgi:hypothetical protein
MTDLKIRKVKSDSETYYSIMVIDKCNDTGLRYCKGDTYLLGVTYRDDSGKLVPLDDLGCYPGIDIAPSDKFAKLTASEYVRFAIALRKNGYRFNKKTGELTNVFKERDERWTEDQD